MDAVKERGPIGAIWVALETWGLHLAQFALFLVLARLLGPEAYGLVAIALTVNIVGRALISEGGWAEVLIQRRDLETDHVDSVFWALLAFGSGLALVAVAATQPLAWVFQRPDLPPVVACLALALPLHALAIVPDALLRRDMRFAPLAARSLLAIVTAGWVALAMAVAGMGVWSLVSFQLVQPLVATLVVWGACSWRPRVSFSRAHFFVLMPFVGGMIGTRLLIAFDILIPRLAIGWALGAPAVGQFAIARKITELLNQLLMRPLTRVGVSGFAAYAGRPAQLRALLQRMAEVGALAACPSFVGLAFIAPEFVPLALGPQWLPSVPAIQILAVLGVITPLVRLESALMCGLGRADIQLALSVVGTVVLLGCLTVVQPSSLAGFAGVIVARSCLTFPLHLILVRRASGIDVLALVRTSVFPLLAALMMLGALLAVASLLPEDLHAAWRLLAFVTAGALTYAAALFVLARSLILKLLDVLRSALFVQQRTLPSRAGGSGAG